ncbi:hypothetical protein ACWCV9_37255 [Streptomyces sp. NPDC001606]
MASKQGRQERPIDPAEGPVALFAIDLRRLREQSGSPTYRQLATWSAKVGSPYSDTTFSSAARGHALPSREVVLAYVRACLAYSKTDAHRIDSAVADWTARWEALQSDLNPEPTPRPPAPVPPTAHDPGAPPAALPGPRPEPPKSRRTGKPHRPPNDRGKQLLLAVAGLAAIGLFALAARYVAAPGSAAAEGESMPPAAQPPAAAHPSASPTIRALPPHPSTTVPTPAGLGGNSRCGKVRYVNGLAWTACTRADSDHLAFAVQLTNTGPEKVTVRAKLAYVRATVAHTCPGPWGSGVELTVAPGETVTSPLTECTAAKLPATAFQAKAWVVTPDETSWGYREMSQTIHVQPDGRTTLWADEA